MEDIKIATLRAAFRVILFTLIGAIALLFMGCTEIRYFLFVSYTAVLAAVLG